MALWDKITSKGNVEDRRGMGPIAIGGVGATGLAIVLLYNVLTGGDLGSVLNQFSYIAPQKTTNSAEFEGEDAYEVFASKVLGSANDKWREVFIAQGVPYQEPKLVLFRAATNSGCGTATSQVGPHYCPIDRTIYLDETFFDELTTKLGAKGGDVAEAYVIAHEVGHHVQKELGTMDREDSQTNEFSVKLELQADCFAGIWANSIKSEGVFETGEIIEAMDAAASVGDNRIQEKVNGYANPETFTHGTSAQRVEWFSRGYDAGDMASCNTF